MISKKQVSHIAQLARLGLKEKELEEIKKDLSSVLDYIEKLKEVNISGIDTYSSLQSRRNIMRQDKIDKLKTKDKNLLESSPSKEKGYLKVKQVL